VTPRQQPPCLRAPDGSAACCPVAACARRRLPCTGHGAAYRVGFLFGQCAGEFPRPRSMHSRRLTARPGVRTGRIPPPGVRNPDVIPGIGPLDLPGNLRVAGQSGIRARHRGTRQVFLPGGQR
jgi:hypothetical protein